MLFPTAYTGGIPLSSQFNDAYANNGYVIKLDDGRFFCGMARNGVINHGRYTQVVLGDTERLHQWGPVAMTPEQMDTHKISAVVFPDFYGAAVTAKGIGASEVGSIFKAKKDRTMENDRNFLEEYARQFPVVLPPLLPGLASPDACRQAQFSGYRSCGRTFREAVSKIRKVLFGPSP